MPRYLLKYKRNNVGKVKVRPPCDVVFCPVIYAVTSRQKGGALPLVQHTRSLFYRLRPPLPVPRAAFDPTSLSASLSRSIVRDAMVEIMLGAMEPRKQQQQQLGLGWGEPEGDQPQAMARGGEEGVDDPGFGFGGSECGGGEMQMGWGGELVGHASSENPGKCIMWCAVALGALVRGAPIEYVSVSGRLCEVSTIDRVRWLR